MINSEIEKFRPIKSYNNKDFSLVPSSLEEAIKYAEIIADSNFVPREYKGKVGDILIAVQWGAELGLKPMQSLQNISIINGRPCVWGDSLLAIVQSHPDYEWIKETDNGECATCIIKRKNEDPHKVQFSIEDAKKANLFSKPGPWSQYPARMRQMRARAFALRDKFADALKGMSSAEECMDIPIEEKKEGEINNIIKSIKNKKINNDNLYSEEFVNNTDLCIDFKNSEQFINNVEDKISNVELISPDDSYLNLLNLIKNASSLEELLDYSEKAKLIKDEKIKSMIREEYKKRKLEIE